MKYNVLLFCLLLAILCYYAAFNVLLQVTFVMLKSDFLIFQVATLYAPVLLRASVLSCPLLRAS